MGEVEGHDVPGVRVPLPKEGEPATPGTPLCLSLLAVKDGSGEGYRRSPAGHPSPGPCHLSLSMRTMLAAAVLLLVAAVPAAAGGFVETTSLRICTDTAAHVEWWLWNHTDQPVTVVSSSRGLFDGVTVPPRTPYPMSEPFYELPAEGFYTMDITLETGPIAQGTAAPCPRGATTTTAQPTTTTSPPLVAPSTSTSQPVDTAPPPASPIPVAPAFTG